MTAYRFSVSIMPRDGILDPAGKAVEASLPQLHAANVHAVRVGRRIELSVDAESPDAAQSTVERLAGDFLANPLIEGWTIEAIG